MAVNNNSFYLIIIYPFCQICLLSLFFSFLHFLFYDIFSFSSCRLFFSQAHSLSSILCFNHNIILAIFDNFLFIDYLATPKSFCQICLLSLFFSFLHLLFYDIFSFSSCRSFFSQAHSLSSILCFNHNIIILAIFDNFLFIDYLATPKTLYCDGKLICQQYKCITTRLNRTSHRRASVLKYENISTCSQKINLWIFWTLKDLKK